MSHHFAMTMTRPHEVLGLRAPLGRRLPTGLAAWNIGLLALTAAIALGYVVRVNDTSAAAYRVRDAERRVEALRSETMAMQDKLAALSSLQELATKAEGNGYVPVDRLEFVKQGSGSYALGR
jgi:hypothetical protein